MWDSTFTKQSRSFAHNNSTFPLLQEIDLADIQNDKLIPNVTTSFIDENGKEVGIKKEGKKEMEKSVESMSVKKRELYDLPVNKTHESLRNKEKINETFRYSKNFTQKPSHDSIKEVNNSKFFSPHQKQLVYFQKQKGFQKSRQKFQNADFIGGDLYDVEDIIGDINKIMDKSNRKNMEIAVRQPDSGSNSTSNFLRGSKWSENEFEGLSKLDRMLKDYKSSTEDDPYLLIDELSPQGKSSSRSPSPTLPMKMMGFPPRNRPNNEEKITIAVIKWSQMPIIGTNWVPEVYLKLKSYPQQEEYRKVVLKAYSLGVKSYSIFTNVSAGVFKMERNINNDKNYLEDRGKLMSEEEYAKTWEERLENGEKIGEEEKEILMEFDIEWYRTIVELCYQSSLEDLLETDYDISEYISTIESMERLEIISPEQIISNQLKYLEAYFSQVYSNTSRETCLGIIRIENNEKSDNEDVYEYFKTFLTTENFSVWSLNENKTSLALVLQLCGNPLELNKSTERVKLELEGNELSMILKSNEEAKKGINLIVENCEENDWQMEMRIEGREWKIVLSEEMLFGNIYCVSTDQE